MVLKRGSLGFRERKSAREREKKSERDSCHLREKRDKKKDRN